MQELIKKQVEIEAKIEELEDESEKIGEEIHAKFGQMSRKEMIECYHSLPITPSKYKIFNNYILPIIEED
ncbi:hypothetical protein [Bacillus phage vB_BtM_BMBsp2]|nr:hypothetical protein [Bacillus phage vB_BtM_BMBsp2]